MITFAAHQARAGTAGASEDFEQMLGLLVRATAGDGSLVFANPGDWGIDVLVGDLSGRVTVWQAKYFIRGVARSQQGQITASFDSALKAAAGHGYMLDRWVLCVPASMDGPATQWWQGWKAERERDNGVTIELWDETRLRELLLRPEAADVRRHYYNPYRHDGQDGVSKTIAFPYQGLSAFGEQDAGLFFGRDAAIARILELMSESLDGAGLAVVSGVSGAGKSSLLRAGVLPQLREAGLAASPEAASWPRVVLTPGRRPLEELAVRIAPLARADAAAVRDRLAADPAGFALTARQAALADSAHPPGPGTAERRVLLVVDQCEQLFTACVAAAEREAFIAALHAAAAGHDTGQGPAALVVLVIRADFEARLADYPQLITAVQDRYLLTAMTERQLRLAITQPAAAAASRVEDELVQVLLDDIGARAAGPSLVGQPAGTAHAGVLPLLSHALDQAWRTRAGHTLTLADYERTGGIEGAVAASAQRAYDRLTPAQQETARQVFTCLIVTSSDGTDTAASAARADLLAGKDPGATRDVDAVLEEFAAARLLVLDAGTVEISHEALLTAWPLLRDDWLADARADRIARTRLQATAQEWILGSRDPSYLYSGDRLHAAAGAAARIEADSRQTPLGQAATDFLHASQHAERSRIRRRQSFAAILLALAVGLAAVAFTAFNASQAAARQRDAADSDDLITKSQDLSGTNATISRQDSIAAWAIEPASQARYAMLAAAANPQLATITNGSVSEYQVAFSPDGKLLAASDANDTLRLWNLATHEQVGTIPDAYAMAFSPDDKLLAVTGRDAIVRLWDIAARHQVGALDTPTSPNDKQAPAVFSPNGKMLAVPIDGAFDLWNVRTRHLVAILGNSRKALDSLGLVASSPDGRILLSNADYEAWSWNLATDKVTAAHAPAVVIANITDGPAALSPDGTILAQFGGLGSDQLRLWDLASGRELGALPVQPTADISTVALSPDGSELAVGGTGGTVRLWNVATQKQVGATISTNAGGVLGLAFSPDGRTLATGDVDGTVRLWDVATDPQVIGGRNDTDPVAVVAFSPDGKTLLTADAHGATRMWDIATGRQTSTTPAIYPGAAPDHPGQETAQIALSPDGKTLAAINNDTARWWDVATDGGKAVLVGSRTFAHGLVSVAVSPDGKTLAIGDNYGHVMLWDVPANRQVGTLTVPPRDIYAMAFSENGQLLADVENSTRVHLWNVATRKLIGSFSGGNWFYDAVALSPDGKTIAAEDGDNSVDLWDVATHKQIGTPLASADATAAALALSPDSQTLAVLADGTVRLWDMATSQQIGAPLTGPGGITTLAFSPDGRTLVTGDGDDAIQLWDVGYLVDPLALLCSQIGGGLTPAEWARDVPPGPAYRNVCP